MVTNIGDPTTTLHAALLAAQREFPAIKKTRTAKAGSFSYQYADLSDILSEILPVLHAHGLFFVQRFEDDKLVSEVWHESGECLSSKLTMPDAFFSGQPQGMGSWLTYLRRYAASALFGIAAEEDDDAGSIRPQQSYQAGAPRMPREGPVAPKPTRPLAPPPLPPPAGPVCTEKQVGKIWGDLRRRASELGISEKLATEWMRTFLDDLGYQSTKDVHAARVDYVLSAIRALTLAEFGDDEPPPTESPF